MLKLLRRNLQSFPSVQLTPDLKFIFGLWFASRLVILVSMQLIAPALPVSSFPVDPDDAPKMGWEIFSLWDGEWYQQIATSGYDYANDGQQHAVAFFPLFPILIHSAMGLFLPSKVAGPLINNLAFLGAMGVLYFWTKARHGLTEARWAMAVLAWCPFSLFCTVTYTEGLFLLLSTAALAAFDRQHHRWAALWGGLATATRVTGMVLIPAFLLVAWRERRPAIAYLSAFATGSGLLLYSLYCAVQFGDPLAFLHAQQGWYTYTGWDRWMGWWQLLTQELVLRKGASTAFLALTKVAMFFGGGYLLWRSRQVLSRVAVVYGFCALALLLTSGASVNSINRYAYGIVSISLALGLLLARHPRWGYGTMGLGALLLVYFAVRFSWGLWVA